jgi:hypothetical protein
MVISSQKALEDDAEKAWGKAGIGGAFAKVFLSNFSRNYFKKGPAPPLEQTGEKY